MNSLLVEYKAFDSKRSFFINVNKDDLAGNCTLLELICAWNNYPVTATHEIRIVDMLPA